jgi:hypothetical protein
MTRRIATLLALPFACALAACDTEGTIVPTGDSGSSQPVSSGQPQSLVDQGRAYVQQRACASCHETPSMPGVLAGADSPRPTNVWAKNLTPDPDTGIDGWTDDQYAKAMREGIDDQGEHLCPPMPHFADMSDDEAKAIAAYLRSLAAVHHYVPDSKCPPIKPAPDAGADADAGDAQADAQGDGSPDAPAEAASEGGADAAGDVATD